MDTDRAWKWLMWSYIVLGTVGILLIVIGTVAKLYFGQ